LAEWGGQRKKAIRERYLWLVGSTRNASKTGRKRCDIREEEGSEDAAKTDLSRGVATVRGSYPSAYLDTIIWWWSGKFAMGEKNTSVKCQT